MSKEAEEFFRQKTIENAKRPRMKKFLALVNREAEGKILQEYADQQLRLYDVSQQRELLIDGFNWYRQTSLNVDGYPSEDLADECIKGNL
jgi:hypothetical protein